MMKPKRLGRVAVLGAGTMGSRIAAHFANAGIPALLLDIVRPDHPNRSQAALAGLESAAKQKPVAFFTPAAVALVSPGNFEDHLAQVRQCDWIIEAVTENLEIKRDLLSRVAAARPPGSIVSTNTSGIPLAAISNGFPDEFRRHFLGTHFFNPPRYMHLLEAIPGNDTLPEVLDFVVDFCERRLGKGPVMCKDTPNFIANRIGVFFGATIHKLTVEGDYSIEEVDALTGPVIGLPRSASYRLLDIIGLDVWSLVTRNLYDLASHDPWRERFLPQPFLEEMIRRGWLGEKRGQGFYQRTGKGVNQQFLTIDRKTFEYHPAQKPRFPSLEMAKNVEDLGARLRLLIGSEDRAGAFLWSLLSDVFAYSASMVPEISDRVVEIDRAMRWGYANKLGPFELWDTVGVEETVQRMQREQRAVPANVERMLAAGAKSFYQAADEAGKPGTRYFDLAAGTYQILEERPQVLSLAPLKRARGVVRTNPGASLVDAGDGVLCLEFHSKMNAIGDDLVAMIYAGLEETAESFAAMIIANEGENFSVGANLMLILLLAQEGDWEELDAAVRRFQQANMALKYAAKPVVAAPFGMALGGGCEIVLHATRVQASAETYMGMVETGVGVVPAGGGCKEMLIRLGDPRLAFELIGYGRVSTSAADARDLGLLMPADGVSMNPEHLLADAKALALSLVANYSPGVPRTDIRVSGDAGYARMKLGLYMAREGNFITEYDAVVGEKLAYVLSGGRGTGEQTVSEQYLLDLEREAFLSLCGQIKTQERMQHMLKTGKPLRN